MLEDKIYTLEEMRSWASTRMSMCSWISREKPPEQCQRQDLRRKLHGNVPYVRTGEDGTENQNQRDPGKA